MDAYANDHKLEEAISTFKRLDELNLKPDIFTYGSLIKAFVSNKRLDDAFIIFEKLKKTSMIPSQVKVFILKVILRKWLIIIIV